jgi:hypothetical protein
MTASNAPTRPRRLDLRTPVLLALGLSGTALLTPGSPRGAPPPEPPTARVARGIGRPFSLPFLWSRHIAAERAGDVDRALAAFERVLAWLPDWTDGQVLFAWRLATSSRNAAVQVAPQVAAERLTAAVAWLDERATEFARSDEQRAELLSAAAFLLEVEGTREAVRGAATELLGADPVFAADALRARGEVLAPGPALRTVRAFSVFGLIAATLGDGESKDGERVLRILRIGRERLAELPRDEAVDAAIRALDRLERWLTATPRGPADSLASDPYLAPIVPMLR